MADPTQVTTALPQPGRVVGDEVLISNMAGAFGGLRAYSGQADPFTIWQSMVGDTREAIEFYRELEMKDDTVGDAIEEMKRSVLKRGITVVPVDEADSSASEIATFVQTQLDNLPNWRNTLEAILEAPFMGFSVAEQVFDVSAGQVALLDIRDCPQELFGFGEIFKPQTGQLRLHKNAADLGGTLMPENKFVVWSSRMRAGNRRGRPVLREVFWSSWINRNVLRSWLRLTDRGPGTAVTEYKQGATDDEKQKALAAAEALISQVAMAVEQGFVIREEFLKAARTGDPAAFEKLSDRMESKIIRRIVGSTLTSKGSDNGAGTQALGEVHADTKDERSVEYAIQLEDRLNRQIVQQLVLWNYGPDAPAVRLFIDKSNGEDLGTRITTVSAAQRMGLAIGEGFMRKTFGIPEPKAGEEVLTPLPGSGSLTTAAGTPDAPEFADADPTIKHQVRRDVSNVDKLFLQLADDSRKLYTQRTKELTSEIAAQVQG